MHIVHTLITSSGHSSFGEYCVSCVGLIIDGQMFCWSERYKMPNALTFLKCHINHKWIKGGQYPKGYLTWDQIKVGTKGWQSLAQRNKTRQFLLLSHLAATGIVLKIAKRKLAATQKKCNKEDRMGQGMRAVGPLGRDFSQAISDAGCLQPWRKWPLRDESAMQARASARYETARNGQLGRRRQAHLRAQISSSDPLHQKMSPCPVLYGPILGA